MFKWLKKIFKKKNTRADWAAIDDDVSSLQDIELPEGSYEKEIKEANQGTYDNVLSEEEHQDAMTIRDNILFDKVTKVTFDEIKEEMTQRLFEHVSHEFSSPFRKDIAEFRFSDELGITYTSTFTLKDLKIFPGTSGNGDIYNFLKDTYGKGAAYYNFGIKVHQKIVCDKSGVMREYDRNIMVADKGGINCFINNYTDTAQFAFYSHWSKTIKDAIVFEAHRQTKQELLLMHQQIKKAEKKVSAKEVFVTYSCPNCGNPLKLNESGYMVCDFCGTELYRQEKTSDLTGDSQNNKDKLEDISKYLWND